LLFSTASTGHTSLSKDLIFLLSEPVMSLRVFNTLTKKTEILQPMVPNHVRMYVCGMTTYDHCHMGHARLMMAFDVAARWMRTLGYQVTYVRNITDIDDKIIKRALERGISIKQLTDEMIQLMHEDMAALGLQQPTHEPRATDYVPHMLNLIGALEKKGLAYLAPSGDVNYAVRKFEGYGKLSGKSLDQLRAGERVAVLDDKHDPLDFVLWKSAKPNEPDDAKWPSSYGAGRPGWHIECSAMACALLGEQFDIHGGGADLQFPHHENEIAQSEGAFGVPLANIWMHNGFLNVNNEKMSKSLGNFFTIREVLERYDGETLRFFMLRTHYRSPFNFSDTSLDDTRSALRRLYTALDAVEASSSTAPLDWTQPQAARFQAAMNEDFNTPEAIAVLFELAHQVNTESDPSKALLLKQLAATLGVLQQAPRAYLQGQKTPNQDAEIQQKIAQRAAAKAARNFELADQIRNDLLKLGIVLQDSPEGTQWMKV
jgi:cysteinyl-tRNA synthetase